MGTLRARVLTQSTLILVHAVLMLRCRFEDLLLAMAWTRPFWFCLRWHRLTVLLAFVASNGYALDRKRPLAEFDRDSHRGNPSRACARGVVLE